MPTADVKAYPRCDECTKTNHETCSGCVGCGCVESARFAAHLSKINGGKQKP